MRYQRAYQHIFEGPNWPTNLLWTSGCALVPLLGWTVLIGYAVEVLESVRRGGREAQPNFEPLRLQAYLARGLWPATVQLLAVLPVIVLTVGCFVLINYLLGDPKHSTFTVRTVASVFAPCLVLLVLLLTMFLLPLTIYTGLGGSGQVSDAWRFMQSFMRFVGRELFLAQVFLVLTGLCLLVIGAMACLIGLPPALALTTLAQYHLMAQLYDLYLQRGGLPVTALVETSLTGAPA
jgi:hypothetical protein